MCLWCASSCVSVSTQEKSVGLDMASASNNFRSVLGFWATVSCKADSVLINQKWYMLHSCFIVPSEMWKTPRWLCWKINEQRTFSLNLISDTENHDWEKGQQKCGGSFGYVSTVVIFCFMATRTTKIKGDLPAATFILFIQWIRRNETFSNPFNNTKIILTWLTLNGTKDCNLIIVNIIQIKLSV